MKAVEKLFNKEDSGFNGYYKIFLVSTNNEKFKKFLEDHTTDKGNIYQSIINHKDNIIIIHNLYIEPSFRNKGHGSQLLKEIITLYNIDCAILSCDILQNQRFGFCIEDFYERHNFKTIEYYQDFPLMIFPQNLALSVIKNINNV